MKTLLALLLLGISSLASAEVCTSVIQDRFGYEYENFTRSSYSQQAACDQAVYDCRRALSDAQASGRYYDATCEIKYNNPTPPPYPNPYPPYPGPNPNPGPGPSILCQTDLVNYYGQVVRSFTAPGSSAYDACNASDNFCRTELSRNSSGAYTCVNRGVTNGRDPYPPSRNRTEQCTANRLDPAGMFVQSYTATSTGPINSDVKGDACRRAVSDCSRDLRGRQTCSIGR